MELDLVVSEARISDKTHLESMRSVCLELLEREHGRSGEGPIYTAKELIEFALAPDRDALMRPRKEQESRDREGSWT